MKRLLVPALLLLMAGCGSTGMPADTTLASHISRAEIGRGQIQ
jgi:hypothetical protein